MPQQKGQAYSAPLVRAASTDVLLSSPRPSSGRRALAVDALAAPRARIEPGEPALDRGYAVEACSLRRSVSVPAEAGSGENGWSSTEGEDGRVRD